MVQRRLGRLGAALLVCALAATPALAQITTGNVAGSVKDAQGGVIPGATVVLISETKGTKSAPAVTSETGDYTFPNVTADTYTVEISMDTFKTVKRENVRVSGGDRVSVPAVVLEVGGRSETVTVTAESPLIQANSAERSFAVTTEQVENLPISHSNFTSLIQLVPGVRGRGANQDGARIGGASQDNIMMDGISAMDTGNNGQMLNMNIESIAEVKVLTQGYQAEYGRSSGLQITAVTKSGTNRFRGSAYQLSTNSDWNTNRHLNDLNGDPKAVSKSTTRGYSIGGPIGKPGGNNKLFFFYAHEYRPSSQAINSGNPIRLRVPTAAERAGDFSQTVDNNGAAFPYIKDPTLSGACSATDQSACFADGGVLGKIPASRFWALGPAILNRFPAPNRTQTAGTNYNYQVGGAGFPDLPVVDQLVQQPAVRLDYQLSQKLRLTGKYSGERQRALTTPGGIQTNGLPGYTDSFFPYPNITNYAVTANYTINPTTFLEGTYGMIKNELTGGNNGGILTAASSNRLDAASGLAGFPLLYPNAGIVPSGAYAYGVLNAVNPPFWDGTMLNLPPTFAWGGRVGAAPPNQQYPGWLNVNKTQDVAVSLTKVAGRHSMKAGFYNNHSYKAQNIGGTAFQGSVDFADNTTNALNTGFGYANALVGVFNQYTQGSKFVEGSMLYNNTEFYAQDNWKVNNRLTLDYGIRFTHQQPQYDQFQQMSNFFPDKFSTAAAPTLYIAGCNNGATQCTGNARNAMDPRNGQILVIQNSANSGAAIGTPVPGSGNAATNGILQAGNGISKYSYTWPALVVGPRFGAAYDLSGNQSMVFRGGGGIFYDRPDGNSTFSIPGNPPIATNTDLRNSTFQTLNPQASFLPVPGLTTFQYDAKVPASAQWQAGIQKTLPWASVVDVTYVGNHGYNRLGGTQNQNLVNLNAIDIGAAYLPATQDLTAAPSLVPGATSYAATNASLVRPFRGLGGINQNTTEFHDTYHSIQSNFNRRYRNGFSFGVNYVLSLSLSGNTGLTQRLTHNPDGSITIRADQAQWESNLDQLNLQRHLIKANWVYSIPHIPTPNAATKAIGYVLNDWQWSGLFTGGSGNRYDLTYSYNANGNAVNLTGSPDYGNNGTGARIMYTGDPGKGCSGDRFVQFNTASVQGPGYNSTGMESGRNVMVSCPDHTFDMAVARNVRIKSMNIQLRVDAFNVFNTAIITGRQNQAQFNSPTDMTLRNPQYVVNAGDTTLAPGAVGTVLATGRDLPRNAGFGAANAWSTNSQNGNYQRFIQFQARFQF